MHTFEKESSRKSQYQVQRPREESTSGMFEKQLRWLSE